MDSQEPPAKRQKREKPNKKWTEKDIAAILDFLQESPELEKPTAQLFYSKLLEKTGIAASWSMIRWKVRNLRISFNKANDWRRSTGAGLLEADEGVNSIQKKILQICPYYDQLKEIFGEKRDTEAAVVIDTLNEDGFEAIIETSMGFTDTDSSSQLPDEITTPSTPDLQETPTSSSVISKEAREFAKQMRRNAPKSSIAQLSEIQRERSAIQKMKCEIEKGKFEVEKELQERRIKLEEDRFKAEQEWRNREFDLKKLEIEKNERIAMYEIEMKYKHNK